MAAHHSRKGIIISPIQFYSKKHKERWYLPITGDKFRSLEIAKNFIDEKLLQDQSYFLEKNQK